MIWLEQWRALAARVDELLRAGEFLASAFKVNSADNFAVVRKSLMPELDAITAELRELRAAHGKELPPKATEALDRYLSHGWRGLGGNSGAVDLQALAPLAAFRSEWKHIRHAEEVLQKAEEARDQAATYSAGILGDVELKRTRYIVLVSERVVAAPAEAVIAGVAYRHVVVPIDPAPPSVAARTRPGGGRGESRRTGA